MVVLGLAISRISTISRFSVPHSSKNSKIGPVRKGKGEGKKEMQREKDEEMDRDRGREREREVEKY